MSDPTSLAIRPALNKSKQQTGSYSTSVFQLTRKVWWSRPKPTAPEPFEGYNKRL